MKNIAKGWARLRRNRRAGVSLIVALCASALLLGLSLSLIYSASMPMARANRRLREEQCYQMAKSFSQVLEKELLAYQTKEAAPQDSFYVYANKLLEGIYGEYDPNHPELTTFYYSTASSLTDPDRKITVALRKQSAEDENEVAQGGIFMLDSSKTQTDEIENRTFIQYLFYVDVTVQLEDVRYTYTTEYYRRARFRPEYFYGGSEIFYNENSPEGTSGWYKESTFNTQVDFNKIENQVDGTDQISYTYSDEEVALIFEPTYVAAKKGGETP